MSFPDVSECHPTCPMIYFEKMINDKAQLYTIHCQQLLVNVKCYLDTAMIKLEGEWTNKTKDILHCVFVLPTLGIVRNTTVAIGSERAITTAILSYEDAQSLINSQTTNSKQPTSQDIQTNEEEEIKYDAPLLQSEHDVKPDTFHTFETYSPLLFRMPISNIGPGETISITCEYIECLNYYKRIYFVITIIFSSWNYY
eukprot:489338_1